MKYLKLFIILAIVLSCSPVDEPDIPQKEPEYKNVTLTLVDPNATQETKSLYSNLWNQQFEGFMFGHHDDLIYGREWYAEDGRSDTKEVCGDYPAVFSVDFAEIMDDRHATSNLNDDRRRTILEARARGEVITACAHLNNPLTGGDSWDNSNTTVVKEILTPGSETNVKYRVWLDRLADFVNNLKDDNGHLIPIIF
ncbi:MAG: glycosyl hydrolase, partial [Marinoscillum sp.]